MTKVSLSAEALAVLKTAGITAGGPEPDPDIKYEGKSIVLPGDPKKMPLRGAIEMLERKEKDEEQKTTVIEWIDAHPMDGAVAFNKAMKAIYGWASPVPTPSFFGPQPPQLRSVKIGPNDADVIQVPWGKFVLPNVEGDINTSASENDGRLKLVIHGTVKKRDAAFITELAVKTREILKTDSIYRGKAISLKTDDDGDLDASIDPGFLPVSHIQPSELILNPGEGEQIETSIWTAIRHTKACLEAQIPLKRGVLLEGPYGCGKSMTAAHTSKVCVDNGWTFILLENVKALKDALLFAQRYSPAVVFAEDIDRVAHNRDERGNDLLNTIDGVLSKNSQVITVLTTNHVEKLEPAMLRPGRLDAVISVRPPEASSVERLIHIYGRGLLDEHSDLTEVGEELAGNIPATIREVVERSKLAMIGRGGKSITSHDLLVSAKGMMAHLALLKPKVVSKTPAERLGEALVEVMGEKLHDNVLYLRGKTDDIHTLAEEIKEAI